jgi:hypothetical protein
MTNWKTLEGTLVSSLVVIDSTKITKKSLPQWIFSIYLMRQIFCR